MEHEQDTSLVIIYMVLLVLLLGQAAESYRDSRHRCDTVQGTTSTCQSP